MISKAQEGMVVCFSKRLHELREELRSMSDRCEQLAKEYDPRNQEEMYRRLSVEHPASRLRFIAYSARRAAETI